MRKVNPSIVQDIRYAGTQNFTGHKVPGYLAGECILATPAAKALSAVERDLRETGLGLLVYDCYRPKTAVAYFVKWAQNNMSTNPAYNPGIPAKKLIATGYIASRSGHSSGDTVDLTIVQEKEGRSLDMGTSFDFFGPASWTHSSKVSTRVRKNRDILLAAMARHGFANYAKEWWHFSYEPASFKGRYFDFPVERSE